ncbi:hypothetical protein LUZ62_061069 [Rhynchospora pubera]|uniref:Uncharacterized protein n=1 Tax=Rhynchospora pubera TaxID=906938 RepID=A0AAV8E6X6_9POAL|nr:hypothetical protein LUZ62_061069 [Rhynchospora pubera]
MMLSFKPITSLRLYTLGTASNPTTSRFVPVKCTLDCTSSQKVSVPLKLEADSKEEAFSGNFNERRDRDEGEERRIGGIHVPRQRYIAVAKAELLEGVLSLFGSDQDKENFKRFARFLDSILHAEHKDLLEEMRNYYKLTSQEEELAQNKFSNDIKPRLNGEHQSLNGSNGSEMDATYNRTLDWKELLASYRWTNSKHPVSQERVAFAAHFQQSFMKLLKDAQFEELSAQDLMLTYALNSDYILTLPIYVDWKRASQSKAIIFRRGYATERQKGLLLVEKLDYLQSKLLQRIFFGLSKPLSNIGKYIIEAVERSTGKEDPENWIEKLKLWFKEQYSPDNLLLRTSNKKIGSDETADEGPELPIWIAAQRAVSRYEGLLSPVGPRGRLVRKLLTWTGLIPSLPEASVNFEIDNKKYLENYLRPNFLPRITLTNIWEPATKESCGGNVWEMIKASIGILFRKSTLQEPAFQELILLYTDGGQSTEMDDNVLPLQLKIYERIPIPDLPVVFPHKKLSFRILDAVRLDLATIIGLLAYLVNYKFESIASSPSAILLDIVAITSLAILVFRVALGYKQTWDRYQLLVNKTLYEKTLASGFGSVHFLLDASQQQQYKEAILVYALLSSQKSKVTSRKSIQAACEQFMYDKFHEKIEMPIDKAMETLLGFDLITEVSTDNEEAEVLAFSCSRACEMLKQRWEDLLEQSK